MLTTQLVRFSCELRYAKDQVLIRSHADLFRRITGEDPPAEQWANPGLRIDRRSNKEVVIVDPARCIVEVQEPPSQEHALDVIQQRVSAISEFFDMPEIARWGARFVWIVEYKDGIENLMSTFRERLQSGFELAKDATDVAIVLHFGQEGQDGSQLHLGPMWKEQLLDRYLRLGDKEYPSAFLTADVDCWDVNHPEYSIRHLRRFLARSLESSLKYAQRAFEDIQK